MTMAPESPQTTNDRPASPREKLLLARQLHRERGDAWDENAWRRVINDDYRERGYPASMLLEENVDGAEVFSEDPRVARAVRMNDERAMAVIRDERLRLQDAVSEEKFRENERAALRAEIEALRKQNEELVSGRREGTFMAANPLDTTPKIDGFPTEINTMRQIQNYAAERGIELPPIGNMTKKHLLGLVRQGMEEKVRNEGIGKPVETVLSDGTDELE